MVGKTRTHTGFRMPPDIEKKVIALVENREFTTKSDVFIAALRFYFDNKNSNFEDQIERYLSSDRGRNYLKSILSDSKSLDD